MAATSGRGVCCRGCGDMRSGTCAFGRETVIRPLKSSANLQHQYGCFQLGHAGKGPLAATPTQKGECTCSEALLGIRPAARVSLPMWMIPRRKVPVVMTTLLHSTRSPAAIRHPSLKGLQGQPCTDCMSHACCSAAATLVWRVTVKSASHVIFGGAKHARAVCSSCSPPHPPENVQDTQLPPSEHRGPT